MFNNLVFSANAVLPIFLLLVIGFVLRQKGFFTDEFCMVCDKMVFKIALPALTFRQIYVADYKNFPSGDFIYFAVISVIVSFLGTMAISPLFIKDKASRGAFSQAITRSNYSIVGMPLAKNLFGEAGLSTASLFLPITIPIYNVFAVIILSINSSDGEKKGFVKTLKGILINILKNPLIIAVALGLIVKFLNISFPAFAENTIGNLSDLAIPIALLSLGAGMKPENLKGRVKLAVTASVIKTVLMPAIFCITAILLGFRGVNLGMMLVLFGGPTAVSCYVMAINMKSDYKLTAQIIILTTFLCAFTVFVFTFIFKQFGLI